MNSIDFTVVIPAFNEECRLPKARTVFSVLSVWESRSLAWHTASALGIWRLDTAESRQEHIDNGKLPVVRAISEQRTKPDLKPHNQPGKTVNQIGSNLFQRTYWKRE